MANATLVDNNQVPLGTVTNPVAVKPGTGQTFTLASAGYTASVSFNRTSDTNAYTANDVVGTATGSTAAQALSAIGPSGGGEVLITSATLEIDVTAVPSGMTSFNLALYNVTPPSALGDNAAWDLPSGDRASYLGTLSLGSPVDIGSTLYVATDQINRQITVPSGAVLYGYLVTVGGYTPASGTTFKYALHGVGI
jgi:hypothetical protein